MTQGIFRQLASAGEVGRRGARFVTPALALALIACEGSNGGVEDGTVEDFTIVVEADKSRILEQEAKLKETQQTVEQERARLEAERRSLEEKLASSSKQDRRLRESLEADAARIADEERKLRERYSKVDTERDALEQEKNRLLERISKLTKQDASSLTVAQREELIAQRERSVANREAALGEREQRIVAREAEVVKVEEQAVKALNSALDLLSRLEAASSGAPRTVQVQRPQVEAVTAQPSDGNGNDREKQAKETARRVRSQMQDKGILESDLPPRGQELMRDGLNALEGRRMDEALSAFTELESLVQGVTVNGAFVKAKMSRINRAYAAKQLNAETQQRVRVLLDEMSAAAADAKWSMANRRANQISALVE